MKAPSKYLDKERPNTDPLLIAAAATEILIKLMIPEIAGVKGFSGKMRRQASRATKQGLTKMPMLSTASRRLEMCWSTRTPAICSLGEAGLPHAAGEQTELRDEEKAADLRAQVHRQREHVRVFFVRLCVRPHQSVARVRQVDYPG